LLPIAEAITRFQATIFEMNINGLITDRQFGILESLTDNMTKDSDALELTVILTMTDIEDEDIVDCIIARKFDTCLMILW